MSRFDEDTSIMRLQVAEHADLSPHSAASATDRPVGSHGGTARLIGMDPIIAIGVAGVQVARPTEPATRAGGRRRRSAGRVAGEVRPLRHFLRRRTAPRNPPTVRTAAST